MEMWMCRRVRQRKTDLQRWNRGGTHIVECPRDLIVSVYISQACFAEKTTIFYFFNCKWKSFFFGLWINIVDKVLMSCIQVVAVSWKPLAILFVRGWNCLREKKEERKGDGKKSRVLRGCFKMLSVCFAPAEKLEFKLAWVPYGYLLSVPVLATSVQKAWNSFDSLSSPLLPICCFTLDHEVPASLCREWDQAGSPL